MERFGWSRGPPSSRPCAGIIAPAVGESENAPPTPDVQARTAPARLHRMTIEHVALWTDDLERSRDFYVAHFAAAAGARYHNPAKGFSSYFLRFESGARLEIMHRPELVAHRVVPAIGLAHFAVSVGSEADVRAQTEKLRAAGVPVLSEPRRTGDGYFESVVSDPDGNQIEITV
jgi:lactoylglutathione lyase